MRARTDDPVFVEMAWNRLRAAVEQEAQALLSTAFTTIVRESADLSAGVFDTRGQMLAHAVAVGHTDDVLIADVTRARGFHRQSDGAG